MSFIPAALVSQIHDGEQHVLNGGRIILYGKAFITICTDPLRQHTNGCRSSISDRGLNHIMKPFQNLRVVHGNETSCLLVAAGRGRNTGLQDFYQILSWHRYCLELPPIAMPVVNCICDVQSYSHLSFHANLTGALAGFIIIPDAATRQLAQPSAAQERRCPAEWQPHTGRRRRSKLPRRRYESIRTYPRGQRPAQSSSWASCGSPASGRR